MDSPTLFSQTPPVRLFFFAAIPGALSMLASSLYYTLDGVFVGQFIGATAFAAINLAMPFVIINFSLADLIGVGASVPISIALGRGDKKKPTTSSPAPVCSSTPLAFSSVPRSLLPRRCSFASWAPTANLPPWL